jgi:CheY-like chemotaxis protein
VTDAVLRLEPRTSRPSHGHTSSDSKHARRVRVLVVDDNAVNQKVIVRMLQTLGVEATVASDGARAVDAVRGERFSLVLMDLQMPELDGFDACRRIRELPGPTSTVPVVALTANVLDEDRAACSAAGMNDFLAKPARIDELERVLRRWVGAIG